MCYLAPVQTGLFSGMEALESDKIKRLKKGNRDVFEEVFSSYYPSLLLLARKILLDASAAEDIVHHIFLQLWENKEKLQIRDSLSAYLSTSVRNACFNYLKHVKVKEDYEASFLVKVSEPDLSVTPSALLIEKEQVKEIKTWINQLPEKCGQVFRLSRFHSMSNKEIALLLNISVRTVENQIYRAMKILRDRVSNSQS
jgi:RNA polymerase sigma-70 factor (ECF subfamily)